MFEKKTRVNLTNEEKRLLLHSLVELKNDLIRQGRYTDCVDELIYKIASAKVKKVRSVPAREGTTPQAVCLCIFHINGRLFLLPKKLVHSRLETVG